MYNITIQQDCMNIKLDEVTQVNNYGKGVLLHNQINGILPASFSAENGVRVFKYDITGCGKIREAFGTYIEKSKVLGILRDICNTIRELENYGISQEMIVLDKSMVWYNIAQQKAELILLPVKGRPAERFCDFLRMLINSMPTGSGVQSQYTLDILAYVNRMPDITPEQMLLYLNLPKEAQKESCLVSFQKEQTEKKEKEKGGGLFSFMNKPKEDKKKREDEMSMFRDEGVLGTRAGERKYGFTGVTSESGAYLIQVSNQRKHNIRSSGATIGTLSENQIVVQNTKVSRHHARIFYDGDGLFLMIDERSKNPSYLNGTLIGKGMSAPLQDGDRFRLADEEFEVRMS